MQVLFKFIFLLLQIMQSFIISRLFIFQTSKFYSLILFILIYTNMPLERILNLSNMA